MADQQYLLQTDLLTALAGHVVAAHLPHGSVRKYRVRLVGTCLFKGRGPIVYRPPVIPHIISWMPVKIEAMEEVAQAREPILPQGGPCPDRYRTRRPAPPS
jgi:hypothetical protein